MSEMRLFIALDFDPVEKGYVARWRQTWRVKSANSCAATS